MVVMVCRGAATHPSKSALHWCSKFPQSNRSVLSRKPKCLAHLQTTPSRTLKKNALARSTTNVTALFSISCTLRLCLSISIVASLRGAPAHSAVLLPSLYHPFPQRLPPPNQGRQKRNWCFTGDILENGEEQERACLPLLMPLELLLLCGWGRFLLNPQDFILPQLVSTCR